MSARTKQASTFLILSGLLDIAIGLAGLIWLMVAHVPQPWGAILGFSCGCTIYLGWKWLKR